MMHQSLDSSELLLIHPAPVQSLDNCNRTSGLSRHIEVELAKLALLTYRSVNNKSLLNFWGEGYTLIYRER